MSTIEQNIIDPVHPPTNEQPQAQADEGFGGEDLILACKHGDLHRVQELITNGVPVSYESNTGWTPLHWAACYGSSKVVSLLLDEGASESYRVHRDQAQKNDEPENIGRNTPLHWSCYKGHLEATWMLLRNGYGSEDKDPFGNTPLHLGCSGGNQAIVESLLGFGVNMETRNMYGNLPEDLAASPTLRNFIVAVKKKKECKICLKSIGNSTPKYLCQSCLSVFCDEEKCTIRKEIIWKSGSQHKRPITYCTRCDKDITSTEDELRDMLEIQMRMVDSIYSRNSQSPEDANSLSLSHTGVEPLYTIINKAEQIHCDVELVTHAKSIYETLNSQIKLENEVKNLTSLRPISLRQLIGPLKKAIEEAHENNVSAESIERAELFMHGAQCECTLFGYVELCEQIDVGTREDMLQLNRLAYALKVASKMKVDQTLFSRAKSLHSKLLAEIQLEDALRSPKETLSSDGRTTSYELPNGKIESTLLATIEGRIEIISHGIETIESVDGISEELLRQANDKLQQLRKDLKDEEKNEEQRRIEEEAALKAKKGKKKGKKK